MPVQARCPECGRKLKRAGLVSCPACGAALTLAGHGRAVVVAAAAAILLGIGAVAAFVWWQLPAGEPGWSTAAFPDVGFRVDLPAGAPPAAKVTGVRLAPGTLLRGGVRAADREEYAVLFSDIDPGTRAMKTDEALVAEAAAGLLTDTPPAQRVSEAAADAGGLAAREVAFEVPERDVSGVARVVVAGDRLFVVAAAGPGLTADSARVRRFIDSFEVTDERLLARVKERREASRRVALLSQPVEIAPAGRIAPFKHGAAFDPARKAFWAAAQGRPDDPPPKPLGAGQVDPRPYYLRRYSVPGFRLEAEYRLPGQVWELAVLGDRLLATETRPKAGLSAFDLRSLPRANTKDPPAVSAVARIVLPGDAAPSLAIDPAGRWVYAVCGSYQKVHVCRLAADLSGRPEVIEHHVNLHAGPVVSPDGATVSYAFDDLYKTTWVDVDAATWQERRRQIGDRTRYAWYLWARLPERTFAGVWRGEELMELEWPSGLVPDVRTVPTARGAKRENPLIFLRLTRDGRYLFCLFGPPSPALRVLRADVPVPAPGTRPFCGDTPVGPVAAHHDRFYLAPDGSSAVLTNGEVFSVRYPAAD